MTTRFLRAREKELADCGLLEAKPLVFPEGNPSKPVSKNTMQLWKSEVESISGTRFTVHGLRRTYGQNLLNRGVQLATVSLMLGHNSTLTTEKHYCRKDSDSARLEVVNAFAESRNVPKVNPPVIETKGTLPGYA
jgi:integrase